MTRDHVLAFCLDLPAHGPRSRNPDACVDVSRHMRVGGVLIITLVASFIAGCGDQGTGTTRGRSEVAGRVHLGPQCPVQTPGDRCDDKPAAGSEVTVAKQLAGSSAAGGDVVARTTTDADGNYHVAVPPGMYVVTAHAGMSCEPVTVRVTSGADSKVNISCDTGIR